ncbi:hypothetical protein AAG598_07850 [Citromicrobium bathyomarinum]
MQQPLLSERTLLEIAEHEGLILQTYRDSRGILTWGFGVTSESGHRVERYIDKPSSIVRAIEVYEWLLRTKYLPEVLEAFEGRGLSEAELTAALSFHWNTGAIGRANWVKSFLKGERQAAFHDFMNWVTPREIIGRRKAERALFFEGVWTGDGLITIYDKVGKISLQPIWSSARQIDIRDEVRAALAKARGE